MGGDLKNKKFLKEWDKIKDSDVFSSLDSFAEFYYTNGEKPCFRINTNEAWSKDNFFFGEYSELLVYYKEEQPKKRIGQRFHSLTVLDVFWQEKDGKDTLFAKCKCDCGNEAIKTMDALTKGNARTCGCNRGRKKSTTPKKIIPISKELVNELWDFEKNNVDPKTVDCESTQKYWWKNNRGNSFELSPFVFIKPDTQTSFPEQAIFFYLKEHFNDTINKARYITQYGEVVEIDIYIPSLNVGIEYDGAFWHKDKLDMDESKNQTLNNDGVYVIRIREEGLPSMCNFNGKIIIRDHPTTQESLIDCVNDIAVLLMQEFCIELNRLSRSYYDKIKNTFSRYKYNPKNDNAAPFIEDTCLNGFWDSKKNGEFVTEYIRLNSVIPYWFTCKARQSFELTPNEIYNAAKKNLQAFECSNDKNCLRTCKEKARCCPFKMAKICPNWQECDHTANVPTKKFQSSKEASLENQLEPIKILLRSSKREQSSSKKAQTNLPVKESIVSEDIISTIQNCSKTTKAQIRSWVDETLSPQKEQIVYILYQKGLLKQIGSEASDSTGCKFSSKELNIDFISDVDTQLSIMEILGIHRFKYNLKSFDDPKFSNQFISLIKKSADTSDEFLISGYDSEHLKSEILANIDTISYEFTKQLYMMAMYLSTTVDRPYPCWYDDDPAEVMSALKRKLTGKEQHLVSKKETSSALSLGITITFPDDVRAKHEAEIREIEEIEQQRNLCESSISKETKSALKLSANPKKVTPKKTKSHSPNNSKRQNSLNTAKSIFNALWIFAKGLFRVLWQAAQVLFVIATLIFAFLDGLFFHKIRMQGIRKRAAQKAAQTRKRNAPYKPSKRSRHYKLK